MNLKKLLVLMLVLAGVYTKSYGMDTGALYQAIVNGNVEQIRACITEKTAFNPRTTYSCTGYKLHNGRFFITAAEGLGQEIERSFFPLDLACESNQLAVVRLLVEEYGATVDEGGKTSWLLRVATDKGNVEMASYLISKGARLDQSQIDERKRWVERNKNVPGAANIKRIIYALEGYKVIAGVPLTRLNVGIMIAGIAVCAAVGKYGYDRYCAVRKKSVSDDEDADTHDEEAVVTDQNMEIA